MSNIVAYVEKDKIYVSQTKSIYSLVLVPFQIVNRNYIYTILYMPKSIQQVGTRDKMRGLPLFYHFFSTSFISSIIKEHER